MIKTVGQLRKAIEGVEDSMRVLLRVTNEDGDEQMMCCPDRATPGPGCTEIDVLVISGTDGECHHGHSGFGCLECKTEYDRGDLG